MVVALERALAERGSVLAFLPGAAEIRRTADQLADRVRDPAVDIVQLYGALDADTQDRAIAPSPVGRRKVVLATSIAETSLTIEGVRIVVDSGLARVPRYEPAVGLTRLETVRVSRASADQRRGRAGRTEPGLCYRLWDEPETMSLAPFATPEILASDLSGLVLDLAIWGVNDPGALAWLDPPPAAALAEARALLTELDALDPGGRITALGKRLARLRLPPRLAAMIVRAADEDEAPLAAEIAVVVSERGLGGDDVDLSHRIENFRRDRSRRAEEARGLARRWAEEAGGEQRRSPASRAGSLLCSCISRSRCKGARGKARRIPAGERPWCARRSGTLLRAAKNISPWLRLPGVAGEARILLAARIDEAEIVRRFSSHIVDRAESSFDEKSAALRGRAIRRLGALILDERPLPLAARRRLRSRARRGCRTSRAGAASLERGPATLARSRALHAHT